MKLKDKIQQLQEQIDANHIDIIRQERSLVRIVRNVLKYGFSENKEKSIASVQALLVRLLWNRGTVAVVGSLGGLLTIYFLWDQNSTLKDQNYLIEEQNLALIKQFNVSVAAQYESILLASNSDQKQIALARLIDARRVIDSDYVEIDNYSELSLIKNNITKVRFKNINFRDIISTSLDSSTFTEVYAVGESFSFTKIRNTDVINSGFYFSRYNDIEFINSTIDDVVMMTKSRYVDSGRRETFPRPQLDDNVIEKLTVDKCKVKYLAISAENIDITISDSNIKYIRLRPSLNSDAVGGRIKLSSNRGIDAAGYIISIDNGVVFETTGNPEINIIDTYAKLAVLLKNIENDYLQESISRSMVSVLEWNELFRDLFEPYKDELSISNYYND